METFYYYCIQRKNRMKRRFRTCFFSGLKYCGNSQVLRFSLLRSERPRGSAAARGAQPLPASSWSSPLPSSSSSSSPDTHVLSAETPSSRMPLQNVSMNRSSPVLPRVLGGLGGKTAFSRTGRAQPFEESNSSCRGVSSVSSAGCRESAREGGKERRSSL